MNGLLLAYNEENNVLILIKFKANSKLVNLLKQLKRSLIVFHDET